MTPRTHEIPIPQPSESSAPGGAPGSPVSSGRSPKPGSWAELLGPAHLAAALVLAGGVAMYATNVYVTAALLPSAVTDIGGAAYFAWVATAFLTASVVSSMLVTRVLARVGAARAYVGAFLLFALGTLLNTAAPTMEVLLLGRAVQGLGGGLLAGLGYAVIRTALPAHLWTRAAGLVSAMWGVGNLVGPTLGGLFAQWGIWRGAFALLAAIALVLAWVSRRAVPGTTARTGDLPPVPVLSLVLLSAAAAVFSITSVVPRGLPTVAGLGVALLLLVLFVLRERAASATVLPRFTYRRGNSLKWIYLTLGLLSAGAMAEAFVPLFGQELAGLSPLIAGFLGASLSVGWTVAQLLSVGIERPLGRRLVSVAGPGLLALGLLSYAALVAEDAGPWLVATWAAALFAAGAGIGMAFPHLSVAAMRSTEDPVAGAQAAAGVSTTQLIANSVSSAIVGILVAAGGPSALGAAQTMAVGIGTLAVLGVGTALLVLRSRTV